MEKALYDQQPPQYQRDKDGSTVFRWDYETTTDDDGNTLHMCYECRLHVTPTQENIERAAVETLYSLSDQSVLLHDNNKSMVESGRPTAAYTDFLADVKKVRAAVQDYFDSTQEHDADWEELRVAEKLAQAKADKKVELQQEKCRRRDAGMTIDGILWDTDYAAQTMYTQFAVGLSSNPQLSINPWKASAGVYSIMDAAMIQQIIAHWTVYVSGITATQQAKEAEIDALLSISEVEDYDVATGW